MQANQHTLLAKQPIYNKNHSLYGFELLFRDAIHKHALEVGEDIATSQVLVNYASSVSNEIDSQGHPVFINVSETFLLSEAFLPIEKSYVVIEILERIDVTDEFVNAVKSWHKKGYQFALDDYDFDEKWDPLLKFVKYIKVDIMDTDLDTLGEKIASLNNKFTLVAERIEDHATFKQCIDFGFDLFQGYYLARPKELLGNSIRPSSAITAQIINKIEEPDSSIHEIAELVSHDPKLTLQLIKIINSSLFTLPREINDLKEAINFLGIDLLKQWALMIAFVSDAQAHIESCRIVLIRAKACELYFEQEQDEDDLAASSFLAALLSGVDLLLEIQPEVFIESLNLNARIREAVLTDTGELGKIIQKIKDIEYFITQDPSNVINIDASLLGYYSQAQRWAGEVIETLLEQSQNK